MQSSNVRCNLSIKIILVSLAAVRGESVFTSLVFLLLTIASLDTITDRPSKFLTSTNASRLADAQRLTGSCGDGVSLPFVVVSIGLNSGIVNSKYVRGLGTTENLDMVERDAVAAIWAFASERPGSRTRSEDGSNRNVPGIKGR